MLPDNSSLKALDLPSGNGRMTTVLARKYNDVTAVDNSRGMLDACNKRMHEEGLEARVTLKHASATDLPFQDDSFDLSLFLGLLEHLPVEPRQKALKEVVRVTKPNGMMIFTVNNSNSFFLKLNPVYQRSEQYLQGDLKGFYNGAVGREWLFETLNKLGASCEVVAANTLQSFYTHLFRSTDKKTWQHSAWSSLFSSAAEIDVVIPLNQDFDDIFADVFIVKAIKG